MSDLDTRVLAPAPEVEVADPIVLEIRAGRRGELDHKLEVANRRLARAGIDQRFAAQYEPFLKTVRKGAIELEDGTLFGGVEVQEEWLRVTMDEFRITTGHYTFVAALVAEEAGYTVHCAPGQSLDGWVRPPVDDIHCDHCNLKRDRKRLYIIRDDRDGSLHQIGHSCIELYTGLAIKGLWALEYDKELRGFGSGDDDGFGSGGTDRAPIGAVLGMAFAFSDEGRRYVSVKAAECGVGAATGGQVRTALFHPPTRPITRHPQAVKEFEAFIATMRRGYEFAQDDGLIADIRKAADTLKPGTDYADNMHTILAGERVSYRNIGILASLVAVYAREKELAVKREQEAKAPPATGLLAPAKTRLRDLKLTLTKVKFFDGEYGTRTLLEGRTDDQYVVVWWATGTHDYEVGDTLVIDATVKELKPFQGVDQTVVKNGRIKDHTPVEAVC